MLGLKEFLLGFNGLSLGLGLKLGKFIQPLLDFSLCLSLGDRQLCELLLKLSFKHPKSYFLFINFYVLKLNLNF